MRKEKKPKYKEEKATRVRINEKTEYIYYTVDMDVGFDFELGAELPKGGKLGLERRKKREVRVDFIKDDEYGLIPSDVWVDKKRQQVMGTLPPELYKPSNPEEIIITSGPRPLVWTSCPKCEGTILADSKFCNYCGTLLKPN